MIFRRKKNPQCYLSLLKQVVFKMLELELFYEFEDQKFNFNIKLYRVQSVESVISSF